MAFYEKIVTIFRKRPPSQSDSGTINTNMPKKPARRSLAANLGIDFGTCFSKVCFSVGKDSNFVKFPVDEYKESVLFYDYESKILFYSRPDKNDNIGVIRYFKYSVFFDDLPKSSFLNALDYDIKPEVLCCIFFLACLIRESREYVDKHFSKTIVDVKVEDITLGVPIDNYEDNNRNIYDKILHLACKLSNTLSSNFISVNTLYEFFNENKNIEIPKFGGSRINTLPELYAESLVLLKNENTPNGVYAIVDIGGGTVDMAIIFKGSENNHYMISKIIKPLGIETVANHITATGIHMEKVKRNLMKNKFPDLSFINMEKRDEIHEKLRGAFASIVIDAKNNYREAIKETSNGFINVLLCGGGAFYKWYEVGIINNNETMLKNQLSDGGLKLKKENTDKLLSGIDIKSHRLIIAYVLSQPEGKYISQLNGFPWQFGEENKLSEHTDSHDRFYEGVERQKDIFGED